MKTTIYCIAVLLLFNSMSYGQQLSDVSNVFKQRVNDFDLFQTDEGLSCIYVNYDRKTKQTTLCLTDDWVNVNGVDKKCWWVIVLWTKRIDL